MSVMDMYSSDTPMAPDGRQYEKPKDGNDNNNMFEKPKDNENKINIGENKEDNNINENKIEIDKKDENLNKIIDKEEKK
jgi:predicted house-cleaning NTP pyrophosphatase (Maf/HAM1 superfamily)